MQQPQQQQQPDLTNSYWGNLAQFGLFPNGRGGVAPATGLGLPGQVFALIFLQWGLEYRTCSVFGWSSMFGSWPQPFENRTMASLGCFYFRVKIN